jgi:hypothetical protein
MIDGGIGGVQRTALPEVQRAALEVVQRIAP